MEPSDMIRMDNLKLWAQTLTEDEFDDSMQNAARGDRELVDGYEIKHILLKLANEKTPACPVLEVGCGSSKEGDLRLDPSARLDVQTIQSGVHRGWMESMPFVDSFLSGIICWGTFCFLRSPVEALIEANRVLVNEGFLLLDVVTSTTFPLCQTVHGVSFIRHVELHGFVCRGSKMFGPPHHRRLGLLFFKERNWDPARFRFAQAKERPLNYLEERDWPLWGGKQ